jgi:hypothetical protein
MQSSKRHADIEEGEKRESILTHPDEAHQFTRLADVINLKHFSFPPSFR